MQTAFIIHESIKTQLGQAIPQVMFNEEEIIHYTEINRKNHSKNEE